MKLVVYFVLLLMVAVLPAVAQQHSVALTWTDPAQLPGITVSDINVYRGTQPGGPYSKIGSTGSGMAISYADATVVNGTTYTYVLRSFCILCSPQESPNSSEVSAVIPPSQAPKAPTNVAATVN